MTRSLPRGITERPDGTYRVRRRVRGYDLEQRAGSYDQALAIYRQMYSDNVRPVTVDRRTTVATYVAHYLSQRADLAPGSLRTYQSLLRTYIARSSLARVRLVDVAEEDIANFLRRTAATPGRVTGRPPSTQTVTSVRNLLSGAMRHAESVGRLARGANPVSRVRAPRIVRKQVVPPTRDELRMLLAHLQGDRLLPLYLLAWMSGLREGEALALRWPDIDLDEARPLIRPVATLDSHTQAWHERAAEGEKQAAPLIRIPAEVALALRVHRDRQAQERRQARVWHNHRQLVFTTRSGRPIAASNLRKHLRRAADRAGVTEVRAARGITQRLTWHDFRHAWATHQLANGADIAIVSKLLGHRSIRTTADFYGHLTDQMRDDAAARASSII